MTLFLRMALRQWRWAAGGLAVFLFAAAGHGAERLPAALVLGAVFALLCAGLDYVLGTSARTSAWRGPSRTAFVLSCAFAYPGLVIGLAARDPQQIGSMALLALSSLAVFSAAAPRPPARGGPGPQA